jgi:hypothetical protein
MFQKPITNACLKEAQNARNQDAFSETILKSEKSLNVLIEYYTESILIYTVSFFMSAY